MYHAAIGIGFRWLVMHGMSHDVLNIQVQNQIEPHFPCSDRRRVAAVEVVLAIHSLQRDNTDIVKFSEVRFCRSVEKHVRARM